MIKVLIIEDEDAAAKRLQKLAGEMMPDAVFMPALISVKSAVEWFANNPQPDLIFADIQLSDGMSFEIFRRVNISSPVIFTTAYDAHALQAFKMNSVDYLLKPIKKEELYNAITKFKNYHQKQKETVNEGLQQLIEKLQKPNQYKQRFVMRIGDHMKTVETIDIAYFYTESKINFIVMKDGKRLPSDHTLDQLEQIIDPSLFFRINRQFIISYASIAEMLTYSKARVLIKLQPPSKLETIVSTERAASFKLWLSGE